MLGLKHGNRKMELRTMSYFTLHPDAAAVSFDEVLGNGKAEAGAADFARPRNIHSIEALKDSRLIHFRNADPRIRNSELDFVSIGGSGNCNPAAGWRVLHCIVQQVLQDFGKTPPIRRDVRKRRLQIHRNMQVLLTSRTLGGVNAALNELCNVEAVQFQIEAVGIHLGKLEEVI